MTEKRYTLEEFGDRCVAHDNGRPMNARQIVEFLNAYEDENKQLKIQLCQLEKENEQLKEQLQEFRVEKSNRINAFCITNDDYSVVLLKENEAYSVCNMINRLIMSCKGK